MIAGDLLVITFAVRLANLVVDLMCLVFDDPRVRAKEGRLMTARTMTVISPGNRCRHSQIGRAGGGRLRSRPGRRDRDRALRARAIIGRW